jgi:hypothetical protein
MQVDESPRRQTHRSLRSPLSAPERNVEPGNSQKHVKWGPNEGKRLLGDHELDEMAKDVSLALSLSSVSYMIACSPVHSLL